jgi:glycerol-3-phosphate acyltransferase PlsY
MMNWFNGLLIAVIAYLLGSFSTGLVWARIKNGPNLREVGSKSTGASNVLRTMGLKSGVITFVGDVLKALLACWIGQLLGGHTGAMVAGLFVILGHNWPCFHGFKGGKGVASSCAVMLMTYPIPALISYVVAIAIIAVTRFISLGSMILLTLFGVLVIFTCGGDWFAIVWAIVLAALCVYRHRANISRLISGTENKLGSKKK